MSDSKEKKRLSLTELQELYDTSITSELAKKYDMSVTTFTKKLAERGVRLKGRGGNRKKELPI